MERLVTPPRRGTSPSRAPPPPCEQALKQKILCHGVLFALKNDPKGSFTTREMPKDKTSEKCRLQNLVAFSKNPGITPCKKSIFWRKPNMLWKTFNRISVCKNVRSDTFLASQGIKGKEIAHKRWSQGES